MSPLLTTMLGPADHRDVPQSHGAGRGEADDVVIDQQVMDAYLAHALLDRLAPLAGRLNHLALDDASPDDPDGEKVIAAARKAGTDPCP